METVTLVIAVVALVIAVVAFMRTGGIQDVRRQVEAISSRTETVRGQFADALDRLEHLVRGGERPERQEKSGSEGSPVPR